MSLSLGRFAAILVVIGVASHSAAQDPPSAAPDKANPQALHDAAAAELVRLEALDADEIDASALELLNKHMAALQTADPSHVRLPYLFARAYAISGRPKDAIEQLRRFVETREGRTEWEAHRRLGDLFVDEFPQLARASYLRAEELKAGEPSILLGLSNCAYKLGQLEEAIRLAREAADADGRKTVRVVSHVARMQIAKQEWADADRNATLATELAAAQVKTNPGRRADLRVLDAQYKLTVDLLQARIADRSAGPDDFTRLAALYRKRNELAAQLNLHECIRILEIGIKSSGDSPSTKLLEEYADMLADVGRIADAIAAYERLLAVDPQNARAIEGTKKLE